jgi:hypothetical protein
MMQARSAKPTYETRYAAVAAQAWPTRGRWKWLRSGWQVICRLCAECGSLAAAMVALGLMIAVVSCPAWGVGVLLPHPLVGGLVAWEGALRLRDIHAAQPGLGLAA